MSASNRFLIYHKNIPIDEFDKKKLGMDYAIEHLRKLLCQHEECHFSFDIETIYELITALKTMKIYVELSRTQPLCNRDENEYQRICGCYEQQLFDVMNDLKQCMIEMGGNDSE
jgi:hypothetical protein